MSEVNLRLQHTMAKCVEFFWNSRSLQGRKGESLAAALLANGVQTLAWTRKSHRPLGYSNATWPGCWPGSTGCPMCGWICWRYSGDTD